MSEVFIARQGEIWLVNFEPQVGSEIAKIRPAVVIDADYAYQYVRAVVPITTWRDKFLLYPWYLEIKNFKDCGLVKRSAINCNQVKSYSQEKFFRKLGEVDDKTLFKIHEKLVFLFSEKYRLTIL